MPEGWTERGSPRSLQLRRSANRRKQIHGIALHPTPAMADPESRSYGGKIAVLLMTVRITNQCEKENMSIRWLVDIRTVLPTIRSSIAVGILLVIPRPSGTDIVVSVPVVAVVCSYAVQGGLSIVRSKSTVRSRHRQRLSPLNSHDYQQQLLEERNTRPSESKFLPVTRGQPIFCLLIHGGRGELP